MRGTEHAVVYSEYSGETAFDEQDRCIMDKIVEESKGNWNMSTFAKEGTEAKLDMKVVDDFWRKLKKQNEEDIKGISAINPNLISKAIYKKFKNEGEENLLKIIVKSKETGKQKCIDIPRGRLNIEIFVGMEVYYKKDLGHIPELVEVVKIVDNRPNTPPPYWTPYPWQKGLGHLQAHCVAPRRAGRSTSMKEYIDNAIEIREAKKKYQERPYFLVRLDPIKGKPEGKENLEKMKFPCWVVWKCSDADKDHIGMLLTGFPNNDLEYQLVNMGHQSGVKDCCSVDRNVNLGKLIERWHIEVIKGETQCWKVGQFNV